MNIQISKDVVGKHDTTDHQADHGKEYQQVNDQLKDTEGRILPAKQVLLPASIENMVSNKQKKHTSSRPLVDYIAPELVAYQKQQSQRHQSIHQDFKDGFWFHGFFLLPFKIKANAGRRSKQLRSRLHCLHYCQTRGNFPES